jgi:sialate O-acetylesterase
MGNMHPGFNFEFSAVGYFFGLELNRQTNIPDGLINSSWGGTDIEPLISAEMISTMPEFTGKMEELAGSDLKKAVEDKGVKEDWKHKPELFTSSLQIPQFLEVANPGLDGSVWFRREAELPREAERQSAILSLGKIDDDNVTFVNGILVGATVGYNEFRCYDIPGNILKEGKNTIVVNVRDNAGPGEVFMIMPKISI